MLHFYKNEDRVEIRRRISSGNANLKGRDHSEDLGVDGR
jgi:hypothetical protein